MNGVTVRPLHACKTGLAAMLCAAAFACACILLWHAEPARHPPGQEESAEVLDLCFPGRSFSFLRTATRLYVLCQESGEVRVLDAATYASIKNIPVGRVPRGFSLSPMAPGSLSPTPGTTRSP